MMSERDLQRAVMDLAALKGWKPYSIPDSRRATSAGYPDLTLARPGRLVFAELKAHRGRLSPAQYDWLGTLKSAGAEVYVWKPEQWLDGTIERTLA